MKKSKLPLPPLNEQNRIVAKIEELFSELDKGIESLNTAREQLKVYRQAVLKHAFEGKLTANWREENKGKLETSDELLECIKQEREAAYQQQLEEWKAHGKEGKKSVKPKKPDRMPDLMDKETAHLALLPEGWAYTQLGSLIDKPKYGTSKKCDYDIDGVGVLRIPNVVSGVIDDGDLKYAEFDDDEIDTYNLNPDSSSFRMSRYIVRILTSNFSDSSVAVNSLFDFSNVRMDMSLWSWDIIQR